MPTIVLVNFRLVVHYLPHSQELKELKPMPMHYQDVLLPSAQQIQAQTIKQIQPHFNELSRVQLDQNTQWKHLEEQQPQLETITQMPLCHASQQVQTHHLTSHGEDLSV